MSKTNTYEGMFVMDGSVSEFEPAREQIQNVLGRSKAEILSLKPWDERRLAYEINGQRRALYVLAYFQVDPAAVTEIENDCRLNEKILRVMILRKERITAEEIQASTPATTRAQEAEAHEAAKAAEADAAAEQTPAPAETPQPAPPEAPAPAEPDAKPDAEADAEPDAEADAEPDAAPEPQQPSS